MVGRNASIRDLGRRKNMLAYPHVKIDYCQFEQCGFQKPTIFFGSAHLDELTPVTCDMRTCSSLVPTAYGVDPSRVRLHRQPMGGPTGRVHKEIAYHIPKGVIEYIAGLCTPKIVEPMLYKIKGKKKSTPSGWKNPR